LCDIEEAGLLSEEDSEFYLEKLKTKVKSGRALVEVRKGTAALRKSWETAEP